MERISTVIDFIKNRPLLKAFLLSVFVLMALITILLISLNIYTDHDKSIVVPDFKDMSLEMATNMADEKGLSVSVFDSARFNPSHLPGNILGQSPPPGRKVKKGRAIHLTINASGYRKVKIPQIINITLRNATSMLKATGLEVGEVTYENNIGKDVVLRASYNGEAISSGTVVPETSKIDLVCGNGLSPLDIEEFSEENAPSEER